MIAFNLYVHRRRLGRAARERAPNNWETPMHLSLFTTFSPPIFWFAHPIFFTSLRQCIRVVFIPGADQPIISAYTQLLITAELVRALEAQVGHTHLGQKSGNKFLPWRYVSPEPSLDSPKSVTLTRPLERCVAYIRCLSTKPFRYFLSPAPILCLLLYKILFIMTSV